MLNDIELTILSLVSEGSRYGSEIEQLIELRGMREWLTVGSSSIYYILGRLEQQELLTSAHRNGETEQARTVYQITDAGRGVAQTAVADLLCQPRTLGEGFALGLANSGILKPAQVYNALVQHHDRLTQQLHAAQEDWERRQSEAAAPEGTPLPDGTRALYSHGIALMQAELGWLNGFIDDWRTRYPNVEQDETHAASADGAADAPTRLHSPTANLDQGKQIQRIHRPLKHSPEE
jgi:DNA-binding PadR family transcriptional regulator